VSGKKRKEKKSAYGLGSFHVHITGKYAARQIQVYLTLIALKSFMIVEKQRLN
jgi:hypothetical protein